MEEKLLEVCAEILDLDISSITLNTSQEDIEEWDSLAQIRLVAEIEETFKCNIPFDAISEIKKIADFLQYISK